MSAAPHARPRRAAASSARRRHPLAPRRRDPTYDRGRTRVRPRADAVARGPGVPCAPCTPPSSSPTRRAAPPAGTCSSSPSSSPGRCSRRSSSTSPGPRGRARSPRSASRSRSLWRRPAPIVALARDRHGRRGARVHRPRPGRGRDAVPRAARRDLLGRPLRAEALALARLRRVPDRARRRAELSPEWRGERHVADYAILTFFVCSAWTAGYLIRRRAAQVQAAEEAGGERARAAVADERARIARELHDVVAHSVSIIALQAGAAEGLVETQPQAAREHMAAVRRTGARGARRDAPAARRAARGRADLRADARP